MDKRLKFTPRQKQLIKELQKLFDQLYSNNIGYIVCPDLELDCDSAEDWAGWTGGIVFYNEEQVEYIEEPYDTDDALKVTNLRHVTFSVDGLFSNTSPMVELENNDYVRNRIRRRYNKMRRESEAEERERIIWQARQNALGEPGRQLSAIRAEMEVIQKALKSLKDDLEIWISKDNQRIIDITKADILENERKLANLKEQESVLKVEVDRRLEEFKKNFKLD